MIGLDILSSTFRNLGLPDLVSSIMEIPKEPDGVVVELYANRVRVEALPSSNTALGTSYVAEILFNSDSQYDIDGKEAGLVRMWSNYPNFTYDIPLMQMREGYVHARIGAYNLHGEKEFTATVSSGVYYDHNLVNEDFLSLIADRMSERLQTQGGEPLAVKTVK